MKLRLRGAITAEVDWTVGRIPSISEMLMYDSRWFRVTNVIWALVKNEDGSVGYDVGVVLTGANAPNFNRPEESRDSTDV